MTDQPRPGPGTEPPGPLVGRDAELAGLLRAAEAGRGGQGGAVFVTGEPGIGKSRLVDEVVADARRRGVRVLRGRAARSDGSGLRMFTEALLGLARDGWTPPTNLGPYLAVLGRLIPDWRSPAAAPAADTPLIHSEAILRALIAPDIAGSVLVLEDLHDAAADTVATLEYLVDNTAGRPLGIVCTMRDTASPALDLAHDARQRDRGELIALTRLDHAATNELAAALLATERSTLPRDLCDAIFRDSAGNPLMATEMIRETVASQALVRTGDSWTLADTGRLRAPRTLVRDLADRARRTDPDVRRVLHAAAVVGGEFPGALVAEAAEVEAAALWTVLDTAVREYFLVPAAETGWYAFRHPLIEQALAAQLTPSARRDLALAAADAIERQALLPVDEHVDERSGEWAVRAAQLRVTAGDTDRACELFATAGVRALRTGSPTLAVDLLQRARGCLPVRRREAQRAQLAQWAHVTCLLITALGATGRYQEALAHVDDVDTAAPALPPQIAADLYIRLARAAKRASWTDRALPHIAAARRILGELPADAQRAELAAIEAFVAVGSTEPGQTEAAGRAARLAIAAARKADVPEVECDALLTLGYHHGHRRPEEALDCYRGAHRIAQEQGLTPYELEALLLIGSHQLMWHTDPTGLQAAQHTANAAGAVVETRLAELSLAAGALFRADFAAADELLDVACADIARLGLSRLGSYAQALRALSYAHRGRDGELAAALTEFDRWRGDRTNEVPLVRGLALGMGALLRGDPEAGRDHLSSLRDPADEHDAAKYYLCGEYGLALLTEAVYGKVDWGDHAAVCRHPASRLPWNRQFVLVTEAVLAGAEGDLPRTRDAVAQALAVSAPFPLARHLGLRLVAPQAARDGWGEPVRWLEEAESFFSGMDAGAAAKYCRDLLRELGEPVRQRRQGSPVVPQHLSAMGVTLREYEILEELALRHTNREIAAELHLSHRTVERHVANLLTKTGAASRRELAALVTAAAPVVDERRGGQSNQGA